ncbi:MAG: DNA repair protein RadA, partial [Deltaproteobacteria bacterium]|nr:DNA repair protein RadA [Deltaproteobacteria bacterium]
MAKGRSIFVCQQCGAQAPKWLGRCPECEAWNSYVEEAAEAAEPAHAAMLAPADGTPR